MKVLKNDYAILRGQYEELLRVQTGGTLYGELERLK